MTGEIVTLQVGQCGNQVGFETWKELCKEHAIDQNGSLLTNSLEGVDNKEVFFHEHDCNRYVPRTILIDSEPRVLNSIKNSEYSKLFSSDSSIHSKDGSGAGNVWTQGFAQGKLMIPDILDMIDRELDDCDNLEAFFLNHSIAGGTGSGMGSMILQELADKYPKKLINSVSIVPNIGQSSDTVVQPYNAVMSLNYLSMYTDSAIIMDNTALNRIAVEKLRLEEPDFTQTNKFVAKAVSSLTSSIRFPRHSFTNYLSIVAGLVPIHGLQYLFCSFTPLGSRTDNLSNSFDMGSKKFSINDTLRRLLKPQNTMASISSSYFTPLTNSSEIVCRKVNDLPAICPSQASNDDDQGSAKLPSNSRLKHKFISLMSILRGEVDYSQINRSMAYLRDQKLVNLVTWTPACFQTCVTHRACKSYYPADKMLTDQENIKPHGADSSLNNQKYLKHHASASRVDGLLVGNHTSLSNTLLAHLNSFMKLKKSKAYLKNYLNDDFDEAGLDQLMEESRERIFNQINMYQNATLDSFLDTLV